MSPSDLAHINSQALPTPRSVGLKAAGVVVKSGGGSKANSLLNKHVAFVHGGGPSTPSDRGTYAEYIIINASMVSLITLDSKIDFAHASASFVNLLSAIGLLETLKQEKAKVVVQTGAATQVSRMMLNLAKEYGITFINIVRRKEQADMLKEEYFQEFILNQSETDFFDELRKVAGDMKAKHLLECVGG